MTLSTENHVSTHLFSEFDPTSVRWLDQSDPQYYNPAFDWLRQRCFMVGDTHWVLRPDGTFSKSSKKPTAVGETQNYWLGAHQWNGNLIAVTADLVKQYWSQPLRVDADVLMPNGPDLFVYDGRLCRNIWRDDRLPYADVGRYKAYPILELIYKSLCGGGEDKTLDEILAEIGSGSEFDWVIQWFANMYQCPGRKPETSLWLVGEYGGGKNTIVNIMTTLLGSSQWTTFLKKEEIRRGWTSNLQNRLLVFANEFSAESKRETYEFIKEHSSDREIDVEIRGVGQCRMLNLAQWIFATNNVDNPVIVKHGDRRLTFIRTKDVSGDEVEQRRWQQWVKHRARIVLDQSYQHYDEDCMTAFAAVLADIDIDWDFINSPLETDLKKKIQAANLDGLERLLQELNDMEGETPKERLMNWWQWQAGIANAQHEAVLKRSDFLTHLESHTGFGRKRIMDYLKNRDYDLDDIFRRVRTEKGGNPVRGLFFGDAA